MNKERTTLAGLLPGRKGLRLWGLVLLVLALELAAAAWFLQSRMAPPPEQLDETSREGDHVYLSAAEQAGQFATDSAEMGYYFFMDREGYLYVARMDAGDWQRALKALNGGQAVMLTGTAKETPESLRALVRRAWGFIGEDNYEEFLPACYLDCTALPRFLPAELAALGALMGALAGMLCLMGYLLNKLGRLRSLDRLEQLGLLGDAIAQLSAPEGKTLLEPDLLLTADFLAVCATGRICALKDVKATLPGRRLRLLLGDDSKMPLQHGPMPRLDARLLEQFAHRFAKE